MVGSGSLGSADRSGTDSERIASVRWSDNSGCEAFVIEFSNDQGVPAVTPPSVSAAMLRDVGVLRVELAVTETGISDQLVETVLVDRIFVVRDQTGSLFVDFHLDESAVARMITGTSPARIEIELESGGLAYGGRPAIETNVVLVRPQPGLVAYPLTISGYARTFEANVVARLRDGDVRVAEAFTTAADWLETWGAFEMEIATGPAGGLSLFVGEETPEAGFPSGVTIGLDVEDS